ncbi:MAG: radical SAM/SPASM domain-containing protein, partial [Armatimonadaceae bacterium]
MAKSLIRAVRWMHENDNWRLLRYPTVMANTVGWQQESARQPEVMAFDPPGVEIELTNRCNLACTQCLRSLGLRPYKLGSLDMPGFTHLLNQFPNVLHLSLNGFGEPLMSPILWDAVRHVGNVRPWCKVLIYTNGMLLGDDMIREALRSGLTELNVSLDAGTGEVYRKVRRGGNWDRVLGNIRRFLQLRRESGRRFPRMGLNFVMLNDNEGDLPAFIELAADLGVDYVNCVTYATYDWGFQNRRTLGSYRSELVAAGAALQRTNMTCRSFPEWSPQWLDPHRKFSCGFYWGEEFRVSWTGDITLGCCTPFGEQYSYGNLFEAPFREIWNNDR